MTTSTRPWSLTRYVGDVSLARLAATAPLPSWALADEASFCSITRTPDELSIICPPSAMPSTVAAVGPLAPFRVDGLLDHTLVGVLAELLAPLAAARISVLTVSTFDTDWILVPAAAADGATSAWTASGHRVAETSVTTP